MDQSSLVDEWREAGKQFLVDFAKTYPLKAAFWLKEGEEGPWYLYVASDSISDKNHGQAYADANRSARSVHFDPFRVKIVRGNDPIVESVTDLQPTRPSPFGTYYDVPLPGVTGTGGAYFYPPLGVATN